MTEHSRKFKTISIYEKNNIYKLFNDIKNLIEQILKDIEELINNIINYHNSLL